MSGRAAEVPLGAVVADAERDHLVEDEQDAVRRGHGAQRLEQLRGRGHEPHPVRHRVDDDGGQLSGVLLDQPRRELGAIERQDDHVREDGRRGAARVRHAGGLGEGTPVLRGRPEAHLGVVVGAVIRALELGDLRAPGEAARGLHRHHHRLAPGIGEAHLVHRGQPLDEERGQLDLLGCRHRERGAAGEAACRRRGDGRVRVAVDQGGVVVEQVEPAVAIDVHDPAALAFRGVGRVRRHEDRRPRIAARHHGLRLLEEPRRGR